MLRFSSRSSFVIGRVDGRRRHSFPTKEDQRSYFEVEDEGQLVMMAVVRGIEGLRIEVCLPIKPFVVRCEASILYIITCLARKVQLK